MSKDLFLKITRKNWARGACDAPIISRPNLALTAEEKKRLEQLAIVKMKSDAGDKKEQAHWKKLRGDLARLVAKAKRGDKKAVRLVAVLEESGLFGKYQQTFAMRGEGQKFPNPHGDQVAKPLPRKPNPFASAVSELAERARRGDVSAQITMRKLKIRAAADREEREGMSGATEILGAFVGDEARAEREDRGSIVLLGRGDHRARRARKIARLQQRAASGDPRARARLQRVQARHPELLQQQYGVTNPQSTAFNPAFQPAANTQPAYQQQYPYGYQQPTASNPYAGLPPLPPDEEYVQDVYV